MAWASVRTCPRTTLLRVWLGGARALRQGLKEAMTRKSHSLLRVTTCRERGCDIRPAVPVSQTRMQPPHSPAHRPARHGVSLHGFPCARGSLWPPHGPEHGPAAVSLCRGSTSLPLSPSHARPLWPLPPPCLHGLQAGAQAGAMTSGLCAGGTAGTAIRAGVGLGSALRPGSGRLIGPFAVPVPVPVPALLRGLVCGRLSSRCGAPAALPAFCSACA